MPRSLVSTWKCETCSAGKGLDGFAEVPVVDSSSFGPISERSIWVPVHLKDENLIAVGRAGVEVDFIPAGYTPPCQVLDKGINKPFKQFLGQQSIAWLQGAPQGSKPDRVTITNWISNSWNQVSVDTITNTWNSLRLIPFEE
jgi:hypothetical protein